MKVTYQGIPQRKPYPGNPGTAHAANDAAGAAFDVSGRRRSGLGLLAVAWPFILIITLQMALATFSLQISTSVRAFVAGESLWSKGQRDALYFLNRYAATGNPHYAESFRNAIAVPKGDRDARLALERSPPDLASATSGFLAGRNHPDDVPKLIWLFRNFGWFPLVKDSIGDWRIAEAELLKLDGVAKEADVVASSPFGDPRREYLIARLDEIDAAVAPLTDRFSGRLGSTARLVQSALFVANAAVAALFVLLTLWRLDAFLTYRRKVEGKLSWAADHDALSGLANRRLFERELSRAIATPESSHALLLIDLDQFKAVNDNGGHAAGDLLLKRVSEEISGVVRQTDLVARLGGDEFGVLIRHCSQEDGMAIAVRLREQVEALDFTWNGQRFSISASVGVLFLQDRQQTLEDALRAADIACYMAKEKGRNRVHLYETQDAAQTEFASRLNWVQRLHRAIEKNSFRLYAQPITALSGRKPFDGHHEILLRLEENGAILSPAMFLPAAERFGLMPALDRWVVKNALQSLSAIDDFSGVSFSINLSALTLKDETFIAFFERELAGTGIPAEAICFEITETSAIENLGDAITFMQTLRALGCRFSLDDFGVGMSSLTYLKSLPVDYVKIDGSFVKDMLQDKADWTTVEMINQISHLTGRKTIAEFVENDEILSALRQLGVDYAQGYAIGRPIPLSSVLDDLRQDIAVPCKA